jgi:hypothetical protein
MRRNARSCVQPAACSKEVLVRIPLILVLAAASAACGAGVQNNSAPAANATEPAGNRVAALSEGQRNGVFIRAILDAGLDCQRVERSVEAGSAEGLPLWRVTCRGSKDYMIAIGADGTAQILPGGNPLDGNQAGANAAAGNDLQR